MTGPPESIPNPVEFSARILAFFRARARALPWRRDRDPYRIWIAEIMLQQTRIETVVPYYERWMERFPSIESVAAAPLDDVLAAWSGLGYYSRALNIHRCAEAAASAGLPRGSRELQALPGIGRYTAAAIASQAFDEPAPLVDGNVARVLARVCSIAKDVKSSAGQRALWDAAARLVPAESAGDYNQGLMELGQAVCVARTPGCASCPVRDLCSAHQSGRVAELPVIAARVRRADKPLLDYVAAVIARRGKVLLGKRAAAGLYGGLWEVPQATSEAELTGGLRGLVLGELVISHEQELSHRRLRIRGFRGQLARKPRRALGYTDLRWHRTDAVASLGVSSATQAIIAALDKE